MRPDHGHAVVAHAQEHELLALIGATLPDSKDIEALVALIAIVGFFQPTAFPCDLEAALTFGVVCWLIVVISLPIFANAHDNSWGTGSPAGWYIIFSIATYGVIPVLIISAHIYARRSAGYWYRRYRLRTR
ncbi:hypothetical protein AAFN47_07345 [Hoeflea sp. CAU 1731]